MALKSWLTSQLVGAAKDLVTNADNATVIDKIINSVAGQPKKDTASSKVDWSSMNPSSSFEYVENSVRKSAIPKHIRVFGKFNFHVRVEVKRKPAKTDSSISVSTYTKAGKKEGLLTTYRWYHVTPDSERFDLGITANNYELSPRDTGRCVECLITPNVKGFSGECRIFYGPISLPITVIEKLKAVVQTNMLELPCSGELPGNFRTFNMVRTTDLKVYAVDTRLRETMGYLHILSSTYSDPSNSNGLSVRVVSEDDEIRLNFKNFEDRDLFIMYLQTMIKKRRAAAGEQTLKVDLSIMKPPKRPNGDQTLTVTSPKNLVNDNSLSFNGQPSSKEASVKPVKEVTKPQSNFTSGMKKIESLVNRVLPTGLMDSINAAGMNPLSQLNQSLTPEKVDTEEDREQPTDEENQQAEEGEELPVIQKPKLSVLQPQTAHSMVEGNILTSGMHSMKNMMDRFSLPKSPSAAIPKLVDDSHVEPVDVATGAIPSFNQFLGKMTGVPPQLTSLLEKDDQHKIIEEDEEQSAAYSQEILKKQEKEIARLRLSVEKLTKQLGSADSPS